MSFSRDFALYVATILLSNCPTIGQAAVEASPGPVAFAGASSVVLPLSLMNEEGGPGSTIGNWRGIWNLSSLSIPWPAKKEILSEKELKVTIPLYESSGKKTQLSATYFFQILPLLDGSVRLTNQIDISTTLGGVNKAQQKNKGKKFDFQNHSDSGPKNAKKTGGSEIEKLPANLFSIQSVDEGSSLLVRRDGLEGGAILKLSHQWKIIHFEPTRIEEFKLSAIVVVSSFSKEKNELEKNARKFVIELTLPKRTLLPMESQYKLTHLDPNTLSASSFTSISLNPFYATTRVAAQPIEE